MRKRYSSEKRFKSETCQPRFEIKILKNRDEVRLSPFSKEGRMELESSQISQVGVSQSIVLRTSKEASVVESTARRKMEG